MDAPVWQIRHSRLTSPPLVFAIINLTPDSFFDGGKHTEFGKVVDYCVNLAKIGVHALDLGAESTRPGAENIDPQAEWQRLKPVLSSLQAKLQNNNSAPPFISIDTYNSYTAAKALNFGADVINDVSAFEFDPKLKEVLLEYKPGYVLMHSQGKPKNMQEKPCYKNVVTEVYDFLARKMDVLLNAGFPLQNIILDPGIGFGKTLQHNLDLLRNLNKFKELGRPIFIGLSNKRMFGDLLGLDINQRATSTQVATALLAKQAVYAHRVHDAQATLNTLKLVESLETQF